MKLWISTVALFLMVASGVAWGQRAPTFKRTYLNSTAVLASDHSGTNAGGLYNGPDSTRIVPGGSTVVDSLRFDTDCIGWAVGVSYTADAGMDTTLTVYIKDITDSLNVSPVGSFITGDSLFVKMFTNSSVLQSGRLATHRTVVGKWMEITTTNTNDTPDSASALRVFVDQWKMR